MFSFLFPCSSPSKIQQRTDYLLSISYSSFPFRYDYFSFSTAFFLFAFLDDINRSLPRISHTSHLFFLSFSFFFSLSFSLFSIVLLSWQRIFHISFFDFIKIYWKPKRRSIRLIANEIIDGTEREKHRIEITLLSLSLCLSVCLFLSMFAFRFLFFNEEMNFACGTKHEKYTKGSLSNICLILDWCLSLLA